MTTQSAAGPALPSRRRAAVHCRHEGRRRFRSRRPRPRSTRDTTSRAVTGCSTRARPRPAPVRRPPSRSEFRASRYRLGRVPSLGSQRTEPLVSRRRPRAGASFRDTESSRVTCCWETVTAPELWPWSRNMQTLGRRSRPRTRSPAHALVVRMDAHLVHVSVAVHIGKRYVAHRRAGSANGNPASTVAGTTSEFLHRRRLVGRNFCQPDFTDRSPASRSICCSRSASGSSADRTLNTLLTVTAGLSSGRQVPGVRNTRRNRSARW